MTGNERDAMLLLKRAVTALESIAASLEPCPKILQGLFNLALQEAESLSTVEMEAAWDDPDRTPDFMRKPNGNN
jgi:hypothetical protein